MFGLDPKLMAQLPDLVAKLEQLGTDYLVELRRLNDNLEALRRDGVRQIPRMDTSGAPDFADLPPS